MQIAARRAEVDNALAKRTALEDQVAKVLQASEALLAERRREAAAYFDAKYDAPL